MSFIWALTASPPSLLQEPLADFASLLLHAGVSGGFLIAFKGGRGVEEGAGGRGAAPAPSTVFLFSGMDAKCGWALSSASCLVSGGRPRNSRLRLIAESAVLRVRVAGGSGVR